MKKIYKIIAVISILIIITTGIIVGIGNDENSFFNVNNDLTAPLYDYTQGATLFGSSFNTTPIYNSITGDYRPQYNCLTEDVMYDWYFGQLPKFPKDFFRMAQLVYDGKFVKYEELDEQYWKQPEFYPGWEDSICTKYVNYDPKRWTPEGYGVYPMLKQVNIDETGIKIKVTTYFKTGYATHAYQGLIVRPFLPKSAKSIIGTELFKQPDDAENYLSFNILNTDDPIYESFKDDLPYTNVEPNDWFTILKPTHQIIYDDYGNKIGESGFPSDWVRILELEITIAKGTPSGDYCVAIQILSPCFEINQEFYFSKTHEYYGWMYNPAGHIQSTTAPYFQVILHVV